jgi:hypothetical protein
VTADQPTARAVTERPILFQGRLVRAILRKEAPKTQTRRVVTNLRVVPRRKVTADPMPGQTAADLLAVAPPTRYRATMNQHGAVSAAVDVKLLGLKPGEFDFVCPYAAGRTYLDEHRWRIDVEPDQRLWVRESWRSWETNCSDEEHQAFNDSDCNENCRQVYVAYQATPRIGYRPKPDRATITYLDESTPLDRNRNLLGPWKPSIHMPRPYSRISLAIASVRLERLQDITEADAIAEGIGFDGTYYLGATHPVKGTSKVFPTAVQAFESLWDSINAERAPWASNPWLWVITFARAA